MERTLGDVPERHAIYNRSPKGKARSQRYQPAKNGRNRAARLDAYLEKPFCGWDGEGINNSDGSHSYVLLANSHGKILAQRNGLSTIPILELMLNSPRSHTNIIYGGGYDINMALVDLDRESLEILYFTGSVIWKGYRMEWRQGKSFSVRTKTRSFLLYDVLPFFQCTFVKACDEYLGEDWEAREQIIAEKKNRSQFKFDDIGVISEYNRAELSNLVRLATELKVRLNRVDIRVARWDGPGAIAANLYKKHETKSHISSAPNSVAIAGRQAYAGGRFEIIRKGHTENRSYQYDIRSAYPHAIRKLPCLSHGEWRHVIAPTRIRPFGVYLIAVETATESMTQPQPLWHRNKDGTVFFSQYPENWYWSPEAQLALELGNSEIKEGWEFHPNCECEPFAFVEALYNKRAALKKAGDGAQVGLKLGLNSLYGKLAQQLGWQIGPPMKLPPYHCLEWAGWVTSHCRAQVYRAAMTALDDVIAFETDAVFSRVPLDVELGTRLGQWEETVYDSLTYIKSGMYYGTLDDGTAVEKTRGINKGSVPRSVAIAALRADQQGTETFLQAEQTRFITLGQALHQDFSLWTNWITAPRQLSVALTGKRIDLQDKRDVWADKHDGFTETQEGFHDTLFSYPFNVEWINPGNTPDGLSLYDLKRIESDEMMEIDWNG